MRACLFLFALLCLSTSCKKENAKTIEPAPEMDIIAYYTGTGENFEKYPIEYLDQVIYCFFGLEGNKLSMKKPEKQASLHHITSLKEQYPNLSVLVSLGGWGGCGPCSDVFATEEGRKEFAQSTLEVLKEYNADGIDLDWEYPAIEGFPGHAYIPEDKQNFTALVQELRTVLGPDYQISFAAGGFPKFLEQSVEWDKVMPLIERVNIMSYDLVHGYSKRTGHHTPLYSTEEQVESAHQAVEHLASIGVPREKMVVGAAFYGRIWENVENINNGLYQPGKFKRGVSYTIHDSILKNFTPYYDSIAMASYKYNAEEKLFATFDDKRSITAKANYVLDNKLGGLMFWQLVDDRPENSLVETIYNAKKKAQEVHVAE